MKQPSTLLWSLVPVWGHLVQSDNTEQETVGENREREIRQKVKPEGSMFTLLYRCEFSLYQQRALNPFVQLPGDSQKHPKYVF